jgi:DNA-binding NarL/FixJ family response regulator
MARWAVLPRANTASGNEANSVDCRQRGRALRESDASVAHAVPQLACRGALPACSRPVPTWRSSVRNTMSRGGSVAGLSPRQIEVVTLLAQGLTNQQIADELCIGVDTVKKHLTQALRVSGSENRTQLALWWCSMSHS